MTDIILEEFNGKSYPVKRRSPKETARLVRLKDELDNVKLYTYRCTPKGRPVDLLVKTNSLKDAAAQGRVSLDELAAD